MKIHVLLAALTVAAASLIFKDPAQEEEGAWGVFYNPMGVKKGWGTLKALFKNFNKSLRKICAFSVQGLEKIIIVLNRFKTLRIRSHNRDQG